MIDDIGSSPVTILNTEESTEDVRVLGKGAGIAYVGMVSSRALQAISQILLARILGPEIFGLYVLGWATLRLVSNFSTLGLDKGVIRFGSLNWREGKKLELNGVIYRSLLISLMSGGFIAFLVIAGAEQISRFLNEPELVPVLRVFAFAFPVIAGLKVLSAATRITQRMQYSMYSEMFGKATSNLILIVVLVYLLDRGVIGASASAVLSNVIGLVLAAYFVVVLFPSVLSFNWKIEVPTLDLLRFSIPTAFASIFVAFTLWTDRLMLGYFLSATAVGIYQAMSQATLFFLITQQAINLIFAPMIVDLYQSGHLARLNELFKVSTKWTLYLSIPIYLTLCFASSEFMIVVFGKEYSQSTIPLVILATAQMINVATGAVGFILVMTGHQRRWMIISFITLLINILLNWYLVPRLELIGSAIATSISISIIFLSGLVSVRILEKLWPYDRRYIKGVVAAIITVIGLWLVGFLPIQTPLQSLVITALTSLAIFGGTLLILGLDSEDRTFIDMACWKIRRTVRS